MILTRKTLVSIAALGTALAFAGTASASGAKHAAPAIPHVAAPQISVETLDSITRELASDAYEGRAPATAGEDKTVAYIIKRFAEAGLQPGNKGSWTQDVPTVEITGSNYTPLTVKVGGQTLSFAYGDDYVAGSYRATAQTRLADAPLVFVGYGINAPELGWNDYAGLDMKGKIAVILVNDADYDAKDETGPFKGKRMTYYGRWTYKFEEAARRGAVAALIVHDAAGVGYGWNVITSPGGENYGLVRKDGSQTSLALQGWLSHEQSDRLFAAAGLDLGKLRVAARSARFKPVALNGVTLSAAIPAKSEVIISHNVLARLPGTQRADEVVMFGAHWDAYGEGKPDAQGRIYRAGANDDALGIAALLEIARQMKAGPAPQRSVVFGAWTAEERGLLGSEAYAVDPVYPMAKTVANLTVDVLQTAGKARDVVLVGKGQSSMEDELAAFAAKQGRTVTPENLPERGLFYRADHFSFAKRGVPVLLMMSLAGASDLVEGGRAGGQAWIDDYTGRCYHQACDAWDKSWNLAGAVQDIELLRDIGWDLANSARWPVWKPGSEFAAARGKTGQ